MPAPAWQAATAGFSALAGHVNQFLASHATTYVYTGTQTAAQTTAAGGFPGQPSRTSWLAQSFTTGAAQTAVGYVQVNVLVTGSPAPWTISLQANSGSAPSGTPLVSASLPKEFLSGSYAFQTVALPVTGLTPAATYWIVAQINGTVTDDYVWGQSNQVSGASTSANGTSWAAQAYGLMFRVFDQSAVLPLAATYEDSGARWTALSYASGQLTRIEEYTAGQAANGYTASSRTLSYTSGLLTGVA